MNLTFEQYVAVTALATPMISLAVTNILQLIENRKNRNISVITTQSMEHKKDCRDHAGKIIAGTNPIMLLKDPKLPSDELFEHKKSIIAACSALEMLIQNGTGNDIRNENNLQLHNTMRSLVNTFFDVASNKASMDESLKTELVKLHSDFTEQMVAFDAASWEYVEKQSDGKNRIPSIFPRLRAQMLTTVKGAMKPQAWVDISKEGQEKNQ